MAKAQGLSKRKVEELFGNSKRTGRDTDTVRPIMTKADKAKDGAKDGLGRDIFTVPGASCEKSEKCEQHDNGQAPGKDERVEITFRASKDLAAKLERAREVLSHKYPAGRFEEVLGDALDLLLAKKDPRCAKKKTKSSNVSMKVQRYFSKSQTKTLDDEAEGRCTFVGRGGNRCSERRFLQNDHCVPHAKGGETTCENGRRLCKAHNLMMARREFGEEFIVGKMAEKDVG